MALYVLNCWRLGYKTVILCPGFCYIMLFLSVVTFSQLVGKKKHFHLLGVMLCRYVDTASYTGGLHSTAWGAIWDITIKLVTVCQSLIDDKVTTVTLGMHAWRVGQYKMASALSSLLFGLLTPNVSKAPMISFPPFARGRKIWGYMVQIVTG